uniref:Ig-like domain-containing protein n=1 Tax=Oreochromis aureus TaxID=47969 RepID=A0A668T2X5_OREAU
MSAIYTWACFLLWISFTTQDKTPDVNVMCVFSEDCLLPCSFQPGSNETIEWFRQDVVVYKYFNHQEYFNHDHLSGRANIFQPLLSRGNATLMLRRSVLKDRGMYRCHVNSSAGEHNAKVILKIEAPIRGLFLEQSRMSGYEEMKCAVNNVFPAPRVTWETEPPTFEALRPVTRIIPNKMGLYSVDSRLKKLKGLPDIIYICKVTSLYSGQTWTASIRQREIRESPGTDLTVPCAVPSYMNKPSLKWTFSNGEDLSTILTYDSWSENIISSPPWKSHAELDPFKISFGDSSIRLMDPKESEHTGRYTCVLSMLYGTHTERSDIIIGSPVDKNSTKDRPSYWWILGLVVGLLLLSLGGILVYRKLKGRNTEASKDPEEATELRSAKDGDTK